MTPWGRLTFPATLNPVHVYLGGVVFKAVLLEVVSKVELLVEAGRIDVLDVVEEGEVVDTPPIALPVVSRLLEVVDEPLCVPWRARRPPKKSSTMIDARMTRGKLLFKGGLPAYPR